MYNKYGTEQLRDTSNNTTYVISSAEDDRCSPENISLEWDSDEICTEPSFSSDTSQNEAFLMEPFNLDFQMGDTDFNKVYRFDDVLPICPSTPTPICTSTPNPKEKHKRKFPKLKLPKIKLKF